MLTCINDRRIECVGTPCITRLSCEQEAAEAAYPNHSPEAALANFRAGREVWDTNGDVW